MGKWGKRDDMIVHQESPYNAEPAPAALDRHPLTPLGTFFGRNHGMIQHIDPDAWRLRVDGLVDRPRTFSLAELQRRYEHRGVVATLQCAGNRRAELTAVRPIPGQVLWGPAAISTARWVGAPLADVLADAGLLPQAEHIAFVEAHTQPKAGEWPVFGGSIPVGKATAGEVLLAWEMNGAPLPAVHGGPVRVIVPGYIGARSVKWLQRVTAQEQPSDNHFQAADYRMLPPDADRAEAEEGHGLSLGVAALNAAILTPTDGQALLAGPVRVSGYAVAGEGRGVARVDVSVDRGRHWRQAEFGETDDPWAWRLWQISLELPPGPAQIVARAWDTSATVQPERAENVWNPLGYMNTAWSRVRVTCA
ncbi:sulfite oxidase [Dactylosporangium sucinum]|nr:sulfite oxidase [Dactylosporangium sucinum]